MYINSSRYQTLQSGLDALSVQQQAILQNIANMETPGYKTTHVTFDKVLEDVSGTGQKTYGIDVDIYEETGTSLLPDGNNVDVDAESMKLYDNYVRTLYLQNSFTTDINNYRYILKQAAR